MLQYVINAPEGPLNWAFDLWGGGNCIYRNVPKYRNELEIPKRTIKYIGKYRFGSCLNTGIEKVLKNVCTRIEKGGEVVFHKCNN